VITNPYREVINELVEKERKEKEAEEKKIEEEKRKDERWVTSKETTKLFVFNQTPISNLQNKIFAPEEAEKQKRKTFDFGSW
jgi:hypothetical protein